MLGLSRRHYLTKTDLSHGTQTVKNLDTMLVRHSGNHQASREQRQYAPRLRPTLEDNVNDVFLSSPRRFTG